MNFFSPVIDYTFIFLPPWLSMTPPPFLWRIIFYLNQAGGWIAGENQAVNWHPFLMPKERKLFEHQNNQILHEYFCIILSKNSSFIELYVAYWVLWLLRVPICFLVYLGVTCKNLDQNLKIWARFKDLNVLWNWDFASHWQAKNGYNSLYFEDRGLKFCIQA